MSLKNATHYRDITNRNLGKPKPSRKAWSWNGVGDENEAELEWIIEGIAEDGDCWYRRFVPTPERLITKLKSLGFKVTAEGSGMLVEW